MSNLAIKVEHLGKQYTLGGEQVSYSTFRETLVNTVKEPLRWLKGDRKTVNDKFWALDDISFEVKHGEAIGIIGRNGAGKSTLLKILSRITSPTRGRVDIFGRVGSLLEVGTGFHPELTGRENIYLNGAILGMSRQEIIRKFDEIVVFAEINKFLDTPVKYYSSGMYVRLAFAVAAHLEPEILIVDEVLAVGDAAFQKKCLGKMGDVSQAGRTVLFVSHNMTAINALCSRSILLYQGEIISEGKTNRVIADYYAKLHQRGNMKHTRDFDLGVSITECTLVNSSNIKTEVAFTNEFFCIEVVIQTTQQSYKAALGVSIEDINGTRIIGGLSENDGCVFHLDIGESKIRYYMDTLPLNEGVYNLTVAIHNEPSNSILDKIDQIISFEVINRSSAAKSRLSNRGNGLIIVDAKWLKLI